MNGTVYKITSPSNRIYIGSTSRDIEERWYHYKKLDCKGQTKLYNSFIKYGIENHIFEIVWIGDVEEMLKMERIFGEKYDSMNQKTGLNCKLPGYDDVPIIYSKESKLKMREAHLGKNKGINHHMYGKKHKQESKNKIKLKLKNKYILEKSPRSIKIEQLDKNYNIIKTWSCAKEAGLSLKIIPSNITACCKNKRKYAGGFVWKYFISF